MFAVEGLLIFLYTLEYPTWSSSSFSQSTAEQKSHPARQPRLEQCIQVATSAASANDGRSTGGIQLRSQPPKHNWQESMALCRIGDKFGVNRLRDEAGAEILLAAKEALKSSSAMRFFWEFLQMPQEGVQRMRPTVIALAAEDVNKLTVSPRFPEFVANNPTVAGLLVQALGEKIPNGVGNADGQKSPGRTGRGAFRGRGSRGGYRG